jgi:hypothetical protein
MGPQLMMYVPPPLLSATVYVPIVMISPIVNATAP